MRAAVARRRSRWWYRTSPVTRPRRRGVAASLRLRSFQVARPWRLPAWQKRYSGPGSAKARNVAIAIAGPAPARGQEPARRAQAAHARFWAIGEARCRPRGRLDPWESTRATSDASIVKAGVRSTAASWPLSAPSSCLVAAAQVAESAANQARRGRRSNGPGVAAPRQERRATHRRPVSGTTACRRASTSRPSRRSSDSELLAAKALAMRGEAAESRRSRRAFAPRPHRKRVRRRHGWLLRQHERQQGALAGRGVPGREQAIRRLLQSQAKEVRLLEPNRRRRRNAHLWARAERESRTLPGASLHDTFAGHELDLAALYSASEQRARLALSVTYLCGHRGCRREDLPVRQGTHRPAPPNPRAQPPVRPAADPPPRRHAGDPLPRPPALRVLNVTMPAPATTPARQHKHAGRAYVGNGRVRAAGLSR